MADRYSWLDKHQSFPATNSPYTGASTYQFSEYVKKPFQMDPRIPQIPAHMYSNPYVST